jgi:sortase A
MTVALRPRGNHRRHFEQIVKWIGSLILLVGISALGYVGYVMMSARYFHVTEAVRFAEPVRARRLTPNLTPRFFPHGAVIGMIEIPRLGIDAVIVQGDSNDVLRRAIGHVPGTPFPGEAGNIALAGHRDTFFRPLREISVGDLISVKTENSIFHYQVSSTEVVRPNDTTVLQSRGRNELTLVTCYPFYYVGHAPDRFVVRANETERSPN